MAGCDFAHALDKSESVHIAHVRAELDETFDEAHII